MQNLILGLANDVLKLNAGEGHIMLNNIRHTENLTAVISVYDRVKPSHIVLDELYEWAEVNSPEVVKKIQDL